MVSNDPDLYLSSDEFQTVVSSCNNLIHNHNPFNNYSFVSNSRSLQCFGTNDCGYNCGAGKQLLVTDSLSDIYKTPIMKELSSFIAPRECLNCKEYVRCKGGAKCVTYAQTGDWKRKDINCPY